MKKTSSNLRKKAKAPDTYVVKRMLRKLPYRLEGEG